MRINVFDNITMYFLVIAGLCIAGIIFILAVLLYPARVRVDSSDKKTVYECGLEGLGDAHNAGDLRYASIAIAFVLFDLEFLWLFLFSSCIYGLYLIGYVCAAIFLILVILALLVEYKVHGLCWF